MSHALPHRWILQWRQVRKLLNDLSNPIFVQTRMFAVCRCDIHKWMPFSKWLFCIHNDVRWINKLDVKWNTRRYVTCSAVKQRQVKCTLCTLLSCHSKYSKLNPYPSHHFLWLYSLICVAIPLKIYFQISFWMQPFVLMINNNNNSFYPSNSLIRIPTLEVFYKRMPCLCPMPSYNTDHEMCLWKLNRTVVAFFHRFEWLNSLSWCTVHCQLRL